MATPQDNLDTLVQLSTQQIQVTRTLTTLVGQAVGILKGFKSLKFGQGLGAGGGKGKAKEKKDKEPSAFEKIGGAFKKFNKVLGVVGLIVGVISAAVLAIPLAIAGIVKSSESFVKAIDPSSVERYEMAQEDLKATIGSGLTPIIAYATKTVKEWAGELLPIMQKFKPIVDRFSNAVSGATSAAFRAFAHWLEGVANRLTRLAPAIESIINTIGGFIEIFEAVIEALEGFLDPAEFYAKSLDLQAKVFRELAVATAYLTARFFQLVGASETLQRFRQSLEKAREARLNPKEGLKAVPKDIATSGVQDVLRSLNERAFAATAGVTTRKSETDLLEDLIATVENVENDPKDWVDIVKEGALLALREVFPDPGQSLQTLVDGKSPSTGGSITKVGINTVADRFDPFKLFTGRLK